MRTYLVLRYSAEAVTGSALVMGFFSALMLGLGLAMGSLAVIALAASCGGLTALFAVYLQRCEIIFEDEQVTVKNLFFTYSYSYEGLTAVLHRSRRRDVPPRSGADGYALLLRRGWRAVVRVPRAMAGGAVFQEVVAFLQRLDIPRNYE